MVQNNFLIIANIRGHFVNHSNQTFHVNCHLDRDYAGVNSFGEARGMKPRKTIFTKPLYFQSPGKAYIQKLEDEVKGNKTYEETDGWTKFSKS